MPRTSPAAASSGIPTDHAPNLSSSALLLFVFLIFHSTKTYLATCVQIRVSHQQAVAVAGETGRASCAWARDIARAVERTECVMSRAPIATGELMRILLSAHAVDCADKHLCPVSMMRRWRFTRRTEFAMAALRPSMPHIGSDKPPTVAHGLKMISALLNQTRCQHQTLTQKEPTKGTNPLMANMSQLSG
jgi:hypothetical protein